jgi:hypothetical protein
MSIEQPTLIYAIFHLNLAFSSIDKSQHSEVIEHCYWPLLKLIETNKIPLGIELTAYTLDSIADIDPNWIETLKKLAQEKRCEIIASGDSQIIGPLVPSLVNQNNLRLGQLAYQQQFNIEPKIAYVNEQATSAGLLDCYIDQGFDAVVVEWDNPYSHNIEWSHTLRDRPQTLLSAQGREIKVIWNQAIAFQKFQRYAHNDMTLDDYQDYLDKVTSDTTLAFPIYGSDGEVFDYRPGRYQTETVHHDGEWLRITELFTQLAKQTRYQWVLPSSILQTWRASSPLTLQNASYPISVKKQAKYNITRWGVSGRNDLWLNSFCYQKLNLLLKQPTITDDDWRILCRLWASDYRTHLTDIRYHNLLDLFPDNKPVQADNFTKVNPLPNQPSNFKIVIDEAKHTISVTNKFLTLTLNGKRGLAIENLAFRQHNFIPVIGTLPHGRFDHISYGADYYSNHLVMERFRERDRVTDLTKVDWELTEKGETLTIHCTLNTAEGEIRKHYKVTEESVECGYGFSNKTRPEASFRLGFMTLINCSERCWFATHNGGSTMELFNATDNFDHGCPVSSIISANSALGATEGELLFGNKKHGVHLKWSPANCAPLPMLSSQLIEKEYLNRMWFSLAESDETLKANGKLLDFTFTIQPSNYPRLSMDKT